MITYDDLPPSAQKAYNTTNKLRTITMFLSIPLAIVVMILCIPDGFKAIYEGLVVGCIIHGFVHCEFLAKKIMRNGGSIIVLFFKLIACIYAVGFVGMLGGLVFAVVDAVKFIQKKPLIYQFELKQFLYSKKAQEEIEEANQAMMEDYLRAQNSGNVKESLEALKELLDQGVITEEEFNAKKAELLERM